MKIIFAGTPEFAAAHLKAVLDTDHEVIAVYSQPDRPAGRGRKLTPSPVKQLALEHDIPVYQPVSLKDVEAQQQLADLKPDLMVVVAYGLILPQAVLDIPKHGCINVHASLLPRWRGAAPIQRALIEGDQVTGVTIMQMDIGLDTGDMLLKAECPILPTDTSEQLHDRLIQIGQPCLQQALEQIDQGTLSTESQNDNQSCYAAKLTKEEGRIDWNLSAQQLDRLVRGYSPWPVAYTNLGDQTLRIWNARLNETESQGTPGQITTLEKNAIVVQCGHGSLQLKELQLPGGKRLTAQQLLNSKRELFEPTTILGS